MNSGSPCISLNMAASAAVAIARKPVPTLPIDRPRLVTRAALNEDEAALLAAAKAGDNAAFAELMGGPANLEALSAFAEGREPDFTHLPAGW